MPLHAHAREHSHVHTDALTEHMLVCVHTRLLLHIHACAHLHIHADVHTPMHAPVYTLLIHVYTHSCTLIKHTLIYMHAPSHPA